MSKDRALLCRKRKDQETGLYYNRYRYYSPYVGRFVSKDPIGLLGGFNVYAYAPNPVDWLDPLGLKKHCGTVYRALTENQTKEALAKLPLTPKTTNNPHTVQEHVENGKNRTQFISTTKSIVTAQFYAKRHAAKIVAINLCKIDDSKVIDISDGAGLTNKGKQRARNWAIKDQEVLIRGPIPSNAYRIIN